MIRVEIGGGDFEGLGEELLEELRRPCEDAVIDATLMVHSAVKRMLSRPGKGIPYNRSKRGPPHVASAEGDPPAVDTGRLRNSIAFGPDESTMEANSEAELHKDEVFRTDVHVRWDGDEAAQWIGTNLFYARPLEDGTSRVAARPYMRPAFESVRDAVEARLEKL